MKNPECLGRFAELTRVLGDFDRVCPVHRKRGSQRRVSGCETSRSSTALLIAFGSP